MSNLKYSIGLLMISVLSGCGSETPDPTKFTLVENSIDEGSGVNTKTLTVVADQNVPSSFSVSFSLREGQAKFGLDIQNASGTLNFNGVKEASLTIEIIGDTHLELQENFEVVITTDKKEFVYQIIIMDDDPMEAISSDNDGFLTSATHPSMQLVWQDEFNGAQLNASDWSYELGNGCSVGICGWGNNELQSYTNATENINVSDGKLVITAVNNASSYTSARIKSQAKKYFRYGRVDVRARLPKGKGIWPAIWMLGENITSEGWPKCGELDIMELVGHLPHVSHGTVHYDSDGYRSSTGSTSLPSGDFSDKFHVFSLVWDFNTITWYVDNVAFKTFTRPALGSYPFNNNFFFIFNVAVGGNWPGSPDGTTSFPQQMKIDYIRVFQ